MPGEREVGLSHPPTPGEREVGSAKPLFTSIAPLSLQAPFV